METLVIDVGYANLVVEKYEGVEFLIYFQDKQTSCITQDIATIRQAPDSGERMGNAVECLVWTDEGDENYTEKFRIKELMEGV